MADHFTPSLIFIVEVEIMVHRKHCEREFLTESCSNFASVDVSGIGARPHIITVKG